MYVDDDAPNDPGPDDSQISDPLEDGTQAHPFDSIQEAIDAVVYRDKIIVIDGNYSGDGNRDIDFRGQVITVRSENGPEGCIIDCNGTEDQPHRGFYFHKNEDANSILAGFTIKNGFAYTGGGICCENSRPTITNCVITGNTGDYGGGIHCGPDSSLDPPPPPPPLPPLPPGPPPPPPLGTVHEQSSQEVLSGTDIPGPTITNCTFSGNSAVKGGGMCNKNSNPTLINCTFSNNPAEYGGGVCNFSSNPKLTNCTFSENLTYKAGGGVYNGSCDPTFVNCTFQRNKVQEQWFEDAGMGGGMYNGYSNPSVRNCVFTGNSVNSKWAAGGAIYNNYSSPVVMNCIFNGNYSNEYGGAILTFKNNPVLINCTFTGNWAVVEGGGIFNPDTNLTLENCILWDNKDSGGTDESAQISYITPPIVTYSCIQGWTGALGGLGNIDANPLFVEPGYWSANGTPDDANDDVWVDGDYHLLSDSPCIDAGDPNYVAEPNETDLDGRPRVMAGRIDMGAYEYSPPIPAEVRIIPRTINLVSKGNWITCYIWLPEEYNVADIDPNSIFLEDEIEPEQLSVDEEKQVAIARFSREEVKAILDVGNIELTITGQLKDGTIFEGTDVIRVIDKTGKEN